MDILKIYYERFLLEKEYLGDGKPVNKIDPVVSVCVATYQHAPFIRQCLDGILMQETDFPIEIIIGEDGSTDGTREICMEYAEKYPDKIRLFLRDRETSQLFDDNGKYVCRFNGKWNRESAKGRYIAMCEGDDYWIEPQKLRRQVEFLESNQEFVLCSHYVNRVDQKGKLISRAELKETDLFFTQNEIFHNYFQTLSLVFKNVKLKYDNELSHAFNGDAILIALLSSHGKAAKLNFIGGDYRIHAGGVYRRSADVENIKKSIQTRLWMLKSNSFSDIQKKEIGKEIKVKKVRAMKKSLQSLDLVSLVKILTI